MKDEMERKGEQMKERGRGIIKRGRRVCNNMNKDSGKENQ